MMSQKKLFTSDESSGFFCEKNVAVSLHKKKLIHQLYTEPVTTSQFVLNHFSFESPHLSNHCFKVGQFHNSQHVLLSRHSKYTEHE